MRLSEAVEERLEDFLIALHARIVHFSVTVEADRRRYEATHES